MSAADGRSLRDLSRDEFLTLTRRLWTTDYATESEGDALLQLFRQVVPHPAKGDLIFWPPEGIKLDTPEDVVAEIERWCRENGEPTFREA